MWSVDGVRSMKANIDAYNASASPVPVSTFAGVAYHGSISLAVWHGNLPAVRALLKSGVDVNKRVLRDNWGPHCTTQPMRDTCPS